MIKLPVISGNDAVRAFEKAGWIVTRQRGSHVILTKPGKAANLSLKTYNTSLYFFVKHIRKSYISFHCCPK
jgi:hypothetical protein